MRRLQLFLLLALQLGGFSLSNDLIKPGKTLEEKWLRDQLTSFQAGDLRAIGALQA